MRILLDTNIVVRLVQPGHRTAQVASDATDVLRRQGDFPCIVPQVLYEFWVVATRPVSANGLGLTVAQAAAELVHIKVLFPLLPEIPAVYSEWERLVALHDVAGKSAHDARLVAAMTVHGLTHVLTFNSADFSCYPEVKTLDPSTIAVPVSS